MADRRKAAAVDWFVRLQSDDASRSERRAHAAWLAADPRNAAAYRDIEASIEALDGLDDWMRAELGELNSRAMVRHRHHARIWIAGVGSAEALLLAVVFWPAADTETRYETARAEQREVALDDGSRIHLNTATAVSVRYTPTLREVILRLGEGMFDVNRDDRPFVVRAGDTRVVAVGTQFRVHLDGGNVIVTVLEGKVAVMSAEQPVAGNPGGRIESAPLPQDPGTVLLDADQQTTVGLEGIIGSIEKVNANNVTAWREGKLFFDAVPLRQVARELSRYTPGDIVVADDVPDNRVTALLQIRSAEAMLRFLSNAVPVTPVKASAELTVLHGNP